MLLGPDGSVRHLNPAGREILGWSLEELEGRPVWETLVPASESEASAALFQRVVRGEETEPVELRMLVRTGGCRRVLWSYQVLRNGHGEATGVLATGTDVTGLRKLEDRERRLGLEEAERLAREEALRDSEARFSGIIEMSSDAIISVDAEQEIVLFNRGAEAIFGWRPEEVLGRSLDVLLPEGARASHRSHLDRFGESPVLARRMAQRQEISGRRKDGEEFPAEASILKLDLAGERIYTVVLRDISDRVRLEERKDLLAEVGQVLSGSLEEDETLAGVTELLTRRWADYCLIDRVYPDGTVRRAASRHRDPGRAELARRLGELPLDRTVPHLMSRVLSTAEPELVVDVTPKGLQRLSQDAEHLALLQALDADSYMVVPLIARDSLLGAMLLLRGKGSRRFDETDLALAVELGGRAGLGVQNALLFRDVQRALLARDDVLGIVSHDLGNPLQAIFIGLEALERARGRRGDDRPGRQEEYYLSAIRRSAEVMERLIRDLLEIRRIEAGHLTLDPRSQDIAPLIEEALVVIDPLARVKAVDLQNQVLAGSVPETAVDGDRIQQVLSNLVGNAVKHSADGGRVRISASVERDALRVEVSDTGPGIPEDELDQVFDRFWRGAGRGGTGIGLGLSIARGIVHGHGGRIWVESRVGEGSTFIFTLPLSGRRTTSPPAFRSEP